MFSLNFTIDADTDRKIIREKIYGIWKVETAHEYHAEFQRVAQPLIGDKWAKFVDLRNWKSSYPEIIEILGQHLIWCRENGMILSINIIENPVTRGQLKRFFEVGGTGQMSVLVATPEEGERVLKEQGF